MKRILQALTLIAFIGVLLSSAIPHADAASYDVSASVPYPVPTQAAVINPALQNITVQNAAFLVTGTCQMLAPVSIISVWRGNTIIGSQNCVSGTFGLQITLVEGQNTLVVKTANVEAVYGPDSSPAFVTLRKPITMPPTPAIPASRPGAVNLTPTDNTAFNNGASSGLSIVPEDPFSVLPTSNTVSLSFLIDGGSTPYTVELNWGDGTTETKVIDKPGRYTFTHQYRGAGNYAVRGRVRDVLGAITEISHAVVVAKPLEQKNTVTAAGVKPNNTFTTWVQRHWLPITVGATTVVIAVVAYLLGQTTATHAAMTAMSQARTAPKNVKPKGGKK